MINFGIRRAYVFRSSHCPIDETFADVVPANQKPIMITESTYYGAFVKLRQEGILCSAQSDNNFSQPSSPPSIPYSLEDRTAILEDKTCAEVSSPKKETNCFLLDSTVVKLITYRTRHYGAILIMGEREKDIARTAGRLNLPLEYVVSG